MQHIEDNTENRTEQNREQQYAAHRTENRTTPVQQRTTHNLNAHTQHNLVHIVLIFITYNNISKNSIT